MDELLARMVQLEGVVQTQQTQLNEAAMALRRASDLEETQKQALVEQQQIQQSLVQTLQQQLLDQKGLGDTVLNMLRTGAGTAAGGNQARNNQVVDTRVIGKPTHFSGDTDMEGKSTYHASWQQWAFVTRAHTRWRSANAWPTSWSRPANTPRTRTAWRTQT